MIFIILCYMFFFILFRKLKITQSKTAGGGGISLPMALQCNCQDENYFLMIKPTKKNLVMHPDGNVFRMAPQKRLILAKISGRVTSFQRHLVTINNNYYSTTPVNNQFTHHKP